MNSPPVSAPFQSAEELIDQSTDLSSCPKIFSKLMECLEDPEATFEQMEPIIKSDPSITTKVLRVVNSPFYNLTNKVSSIHHAIQVLGTSTIFPSK